MEDLSAVVAVVGGARERVFDADEVCVVKPLYLALFAIGCSLSGCNRDLAVRDMDSVKSDANVVQAQKGRWQLIPAQVAYPAMLLDTVTGCIRVVRPIAIGPEEGDMSIYDVKGTENQCQPGILPVVRTRLKNREMDSR